MRRGTALVWMRATLCRVAHVRIAPRRQSELGGAAVVEIVESHRHIAGVQVGIVDSGVGNGANGGGGM